MPMLHVDPALFSTRMIQTRQAQRDHAARPQRDQRSQTRRARRARASRMLNGMALALAAGALLALLVMAP